jgi:hypothetical protein
MYTIARKPMPRPKPKGPIKTFQLRLTAEESERWFKIWEAAKKRNHYINETGINRRLLGLEPDVDGSVTEKDRIYFQGTSATPADMLGRAASAKPHISEVSPRQKRK